MNIVVVGAQWGDEGKGKIVDYLSSDADIIVRYSGGANAGHTIVVGESTYKLHLVPSGIIYPDTTVILGSGMVIDPVALEREIGELEEAGIDCRERILISDRAHIVLPSYTREDVERDRRRTRPIGTTGRGIGIAYSHKALRDGIRIADLNVEDLLVEMTDEDRAYLDTHGQALTAMSVDISAYLHADGIQPGSQRVLLEGAQGVLLDIDLGTYPYVSSGSSSAAGAATGSGLGPREIDHVIGVFKAYSTRVGNGPFPTEFDPESDAEIESYIREIGREYGVTTGRPRRVGHLDLVALRYACQTNSIDSLALTHLDVYDEFDEIRACVAYENDQDTLTHFPASAQRLQNVRPVHRVFSGWKQSLADATSWSDLPQEAVRYLEFIEGYVGVPISIVSVGYRRAQTIVRQDLWSPAAG